MSHYLWTHKVWKLEKFKPVAVVSALRHLEPLYFVFALLQRSLVTPQGYSVLLLYENIPLTLQIIVLIPIYLSVYLWEKRWRCLSISKSMCFSFCYCCGCNQTMIYLSIFRHLRLLQLHKLSSGKSPFKTSICFIHGPASVPGSFMWKIITAFVKKKKKKSTWKYLHGLETRVYLAWAMVILRE